MSYSPARRDELATAPFEGDPWERQASWKETPQSYEGFCIYRYLDGEKKTLKDAARIYAEKYNRAELSTYNRFRQWNLIYRWMERDTAYQNMMDAKELGERKRQIVKRTRVHADRMAEAQDILMEPLRVYRERLQEMADGIRKSELREKIVNANGEEEDKFSEAELAALGRASLKIIMESQKHEREALMIEPPKGQENNKRILVRGQLVKRFFSDAKNREMMEELAFAVVEEERKLEEPA